MIEVTAVRTAASRRQFINFPYALYRGDPHWVSPLRFTERARFDRRHQFYEHADVELFLAHDGGRVVGRVAAIDDRLHNERHHENLAEFGYFEAASRESAAALLAAADNWARARGRSRIRGPLNPSLNDSAGLLVDAFDSDPMLMMPYNPPAYIEFIEQAGYRKVKDLLAWIIDLTNVEAETERVTRVESRIRRRHGVTIRLIDLAAFDREMTQFLDVYCQAWQANWGFVAPTPAETRQLCTEVKPIVDPDLLIGAEINGRVIGCAIALPDLNQVFKGTDGRLFPNGLVRLLMRKRIITQVRVLLCGIVPEYQKIGLAPLLAVELMRRAAVRYRRAELSWVLEDNEDINRILPSLGARVYKTYRLYQKELE